MRKSWIVTLLAAFAFSVPAQAQITTVDPDTAIDGDLDGRPAQQTQPVQPSSQPQYQAPQDPGYPVNSQQPVQQQPYQGAPQQSVPQQPVQSAPAEPAADGTYAQDDLISAAEGVFGKGAQGLAGIIEKILADQGKPNAYIAGREASGAFVLGLRYGSGTLFHKVEGQRPVYWTGPSVGFDVGGDATKVFVLVYNLYDSQDLYERFPAAEGRAYLVGGFSASYLRRGDIVLIPVRLGVGWRLGANVGYMKFSDHQRWLPF